MQEESNFEVPENKDKEIWSGRKEVLPLPSLKGGKGGYFWTKMDHLGTLLQHLGALLQHLGTQLDYLGILLDHLGTLPEKGVIQGRTNGRSVVQEFPSK